MNIAFFGSSLLSAYWNGAATYYRGIVSALAERGHQIVFFEPDAFERQEHRDIEDPSYATVVVYAADRGSDEVDRMLDRASDADLIVKASGIGVFDDYLERRVLELQDDWTDVVFWDVDAPATLEQMRSDSSNPLRGLVPEYDAVFTYGGGQPVVRAYEQFGARRCVPVYNALDPQTHYPTTPEKRYASDLSFLGNRLPDREARVEEFFFGPARELPHCTFLLGGSGWEDKALPDNVRHVGHVFTPEHNAFNASARAVLNISRQSMATYGHSPATRVFEAAGAGACLITDAWEGIDRFLEPGEQVLVAQSGQDVVDHLRSLDRRRAERIGRAARRRVLDEHTYGRRAVQVERILEESNDTA